MAEIGKINTLNVIRETENGVYIDGENLGEILMPRKFITDEVKANQQATVFIYSDSEDRLVATTENPLAMVGEFAFMKVIETMNDNKIDLLSTLFKLNFVPLIGYIKKIGSDHLFNGILLAIN